MPISRSAEVRRGFVANARWSASANEMAREERSTAKLELQIQEVRTSHVRRKAALKNA